MAVGSPSGARRVARAADQAVVAAPALEPVVALEAQDRVVVLQPGPGPCRNRNEMVVLRRADDHQLRNICHPAALRRPAAGATGRATARARRPMPPLRTPPRSPGHRRSRPARARPPTHGTRGAPRLKLRMSFP